MDYSLNFKGNENIYLRDPEGTELGKQIVKHATNEVNEKRATQASQ